jgi:hypothetical protein
MQQTIPVLEGTCSFERRSLERLGLDSAEIKLEVLGTHILVLFRTTVGVSSSLATFNRLILVNWVTGVVIAVRYFLTIASYNVLQMTL